MKTLEQTVNSLKPGEQIKISGNDVNYCLVERSGNGKTLRYVRVIGNETTVFKSINWMCR